MIVGSSYNFDEKLSGDGEAVNLAQTVQPEAQDGGKEQGKLTGSSQKGVSLAN